jgi:serine/threonine protein kinase
MPRTSCTAISSLKTSCCRTYLWEYAGCVQIVRLRMGDVQSGAEDDLLRDFRLRLSLDPRGGVLRQPSGHLGHRRPCLRDAGGKGALLPHQSQGDHEEHHERTPSSMQCEFSFPPDISLAAKLFIKKTLQKNPDNRFTVDSLLRDRFLLQLSPQ